MTKQITPAHGPVYLSVARACDKLSRHKTWLYGRLKTDPAFPKPRAIGGRKAFVEHELDAWVEQQSGAGS